MNTFEEYFLLEGGAAGHMAHPFDLNSVKTGNDLIVFFKKAVNSINKQKTSVKFDGLNISLKVVTGNDGKLQFALDRGSNKKEDIEGITIDKLEERFDKGHGMIPVGKFVLSVMNSSIDLIKPELKKLGLLNSSKFLNTEYVTKLTNVTEYDRNMIVFHGVNEFFTEKSKLRRTTRRVSKEVPYSKPTLNELVLKLRPVFNQHEFEVFGPTQAKSTSEVDYNKALSTPFGISFSPSDTETKTLKSWLQQAKNSKNIFVRDIKNKKILAMSKANYLYVLGGNPISNLVGDNRSYQKAIADGAIFYHATRMLGSELLKTMGSDAGELAKHEGVVIRDATLASVPVKITGEFIVKGMESKFNKSENQEDLGGYIGAINYANTTGNYMDKVNFVNRPDYGTPPRVGSFVS